jgi:gliding motility-associated-like protein
MWFMRFMLSVFFLMCLALTSARAQYGGFISIQTIPEKCEKGAVSLNFSGVASGDSVAVSWTGTGETGAFLNDLIAGDYSVNVKVWKTEQKKKLTLDTTISFRIEKELCPLNISKYFSPNDDNYNDRLTIGNIENYPNFELIIYNKWGQRVHHQQKNYIPWDGKWLGSDLPDGTYYFVLFYDKSKSDNILKGDVTILR